MVKTRKTITVDPRVWERAEKEARRLRVSHSWVAETALRKMFRIPAEKTEPSEAKEGAA